MKLTELRKINRDGMRLKDEEVDYLFMYVGRLEALVRDAICALTATKSDMAKERIERSLRQIIG